MSKEAFKGKFAAALCALGLVFALAPAAASAATITVTSGADDNPTVVGQNNNGTCTLREAIQEANADDPNAIPDCNTWSSAFLDNDTIILAAGTYTLDETGVGEDINATGDLDPKTQFGNLTIQGAGAGSTTINTAGGWGDRILDHQSGNASNTLTIKDMTITGGNDTDASNGGGAINFTKGGQFPNLTLSGVRLFGNASNGDGGAVQAGGGTVSISNSTIGPTNSSSANVGGGLYIFAPTATIDSTAIINNTLGPTGSGGGGIVSGAATMTITSSLIAGNTATAATGTIVGGGIYEFGTTLTIRGTTISGNTVSGGTFLQGGGINAENAGGTLTLINSTVSGNTGGGLRCCGSSGGTATVALSTFSANPPGTAGPTALDKNAQGMLNVRGSVIDGASPACTGTSIISQNDNVFSDSSCTNGPNPGNDVVGSALLGSLVYNGGPSAGAPGFLQQINTHLPASNSPAVEHVPSANCTDVPSGPLTVDQRGAGFTRPVDFDGSGVAQCDAGSIELQLPPQPPPSGGGGGATPAAPPPTCTTSAILSRARSSACITGLRAAALRKCKHKHGRARANCKKRANLLPV